MCVSSCKQSEIEERVSDTKNLSEQNKKLMTDVTRVSEELRQQEQTYGQLDKELRLFEFQNKELQAKLEEMELHNIHGYQKQIEKLEQKVMYFVIVCLICYLLISGLALPRR